ncbi:Rossmann-like and DUF2520 domain-containing protein [Pseudoduganella sp. GCM10020061]|uniref:Rossmann-like and DUF2520 domain-containing protein n=1 Tax=Pseudoduganella sp. GCM10020061 TaxID=3317345 RepID=UPI0036448B03
MPQQLAIIGGGRVARALGKVFTHAGIFMLGDIRTRSLASAQQAAGFIGGGTALAPGQPMRVADVYMLAVSDDQIGPAAAALALDVPLAGAVVFHCSGAKAAAELEPARAAGAFVASVHPVRSFADPEQVARSFGGTWCGIEGDAPALELLEAAFGAAGAQLVRIDPAAKAVYHAASVFASNYLVTVVDAALAAYRAAGIDELSARQLAAPLAAEALDNVLRLGGPAALTGPIARGDMDTVARQQRALDAWDAPTGELYAALARATALLAARGRGAADATLHKSFDKVPKAQ